MAASPNRDEETILADLQAFIDLRDRVNRAIREIERLREENGRLRFRLKEMETEGGGGLHFANGESPEELKAKIEGFIAAIDNVLGESAEADA